MSDNDDHRLHRRDVLKRTAAGAGLVSLLGTSSASAATRTDCRQRTAGKPKQAEGIEPVERAVAAYDALQKHFYQEDAKLYLERYPEQGGSEYSFAWPFAQAMAGTIDLAGIQKGNVGKRYEDDVQARLDGLEHYWDSEKEPAGYDSYVTAPYGEGGDIFYDDNLWIGLELVQLHRMTGNEDALVRARDIFELTVHGWADDEDLPKPGGVYWTQATWNDDRNTVTTAPGAELALHLYQLSDDEAEKERYMSWAKKMYEWVNEHLRAPNGLYWDHVNPDGSITKWIFTYNQGTMLGANVLLYEITGEKSYLREAESIAESALTYFGKENRLYEEDMAFTAIFFKHLLLLQNVSPDPKYRKAMSDYADEIWENARDPETDLIKPERGEGGSTHLLQQSAFVQINAALAWTPDDYDELA